MTREDFNLGAAMVGGASSTGRRELDFYPTPPEPTIALLRWWGDGLPSDQTVWEPCAGDGAIVDVVEQHGRQVVASDVVDRGRGYPTRDYFDFKSRAAPNIITNPPFSRAADFILHAADLNVQRMALLLKSHFWQAAKRMKVWRRWRPNWVLPLTWRVDFTGGGQATMDCAWFVWEEAPYAARETRLELLEKPCCNGQGVLFGDAG